MTPSGYKVRLEKHPGAASWRLIGTVAEGLFCHKPCTVSGGGKSEISKSLRDYMIYGPIFVADVEKDFDLVQQIFDRDYADRWKPGRGPDYSHRQQPARAQPAPLAGQRDQAADALGGLHRRVQRLAGVVPELHLPARLHHQALRPAGDAEHWREHVRRRHHQRLPRPRAEGVRPQARRHLPAGRPALLAGLADLQAPPGLRRRGQGADRGRHHRLGRRPGRPARRPAARAAGRQPTSSRSTASRGSSSGPTTRSTAAWTGRPRPTWRGRTTSSPTSSR